MKPYDFLNVKNAVVISVYYLTKHTICSLVMYICCCLRYREDIFSLPNKIVQCGVGEGPT